VAELESFAERKLEDLFRSRCKWNVTLGGLGALANDFYYLVTNVRKIDAHTFQGASGDAFTLVEKTEENVFGADVAVIEPASFLLGEDHHPPRSIGKSLKHLTVSL
jgi:hypothetical protein